LSVENIKVLELFTPVSGQCRIVSLNFSDRWRRVRPRLWDERETRSRANPHPYVHPKSRSQTTPRAHVSHRSNAQCDPDAMAVLCRRV